MFGGDLFGRDRGAEPLAEQRVAMGVKIENALGEVRPRRREAARRRPAERRRGPADDERRGRPDADAAHHALGRAGQCGERAVEPAAVRAARAGIAAFQHVLAVEMRAVAIAGGDRVDDGRLFRVIEALEGGERRVKAEPALERQRGAIARGGEREIAVQRRIVGIADRRDRRESVHRPAQDDDDEARVARAGRARGHGQEAEAGERPERAGRAHKGAA